MTAVLSRPVAFDVCGDLPTGTTVLEASAGTGKTFTIAALAARYVAEGHARLPELLLVTFGRDATQELRERVRERLVSAERGLRDPATARAGTDSVLALLAGVPDAEVAVRRRRLTAALAEFDAATIATTHQFCGQMLTTLGTAGDADDAVYTRVFGPAAGREVLTTAGSNRSGHDASAPHSVRGDRPAPDQGGGEPTRFGDLALRLWRPLLDAEVLG